jgi:hypothetical protein
MYRVVSKHKPHIGKKKKRVVGVHILCEEFPGRDFRREITTVQRNHSGCGEI